jgi:hypothetical protein
MKAGAWPSEPLRCSPLRGRTRLKLKPADDEWAINRLHLAAQAARGNAKRNGWRSPALAAAIIAGDDFTRHFLAGRPRQARSRRPRKFHSIAAIASGANAPGSTNGSFIASRPTRREAQHALPCARKGCTRWTAAIRRQGRHESCGSSAIRTLPAKLRTPSMKTARECLMATAHACRGSRPPTQSSHAEGRGEAQGQRAENQPAAP